MKTYLVTYADIEGYREEARVEISADTIFSCIVKASELLNMMNKMSPGVSYDIAELVLLES